MNYNSVFIAYRRAVNRHIARSIYKDLTANGWDVFFDTYLAESGVLEPIIAHQIAARAHFLLIVTSGTFYQGCHHKDWLVQEIYEAIRLRRNIVVLMDELADIKSEFQYLPQDLRLYLGKCSAVPLDQYEYDQALHLLRSTYLHTSEELTILPVPVEERSEIKRRMAIIDASQSVSIPPAIQKPHSRKAIFLPQPFAWIEIPGAGYSIAKYPVTNSQYRAFIEAGGYHNPKWWIPTGSPERNKRQFEVNKEAQNPSRCWDQPEYWNDPKWNGDDYPVVGISWYEAIAFSRWYSDLSGEWVTLPTEKQWQYAAQGRDGRAYPWGNTWDKTRCNNNVGSNGAGRTTPVQQYEGLGDSPFGVVDMAGNVWEWCLTDYNSGVNNVDIFAQYRVLRGRSWHCDRTDYYQCDFRNAANPKERDTVFGFRLVNNQL